jgi:large subunit ribosomal protein L22
MLYTSIQKNISHSPRKLRLVADMVKKTEPYKALQILQFTNKAAATDLAKAIKTALANAKEASDIAFSSIQINEGPTRRARRYRIGTAGRHGGRPYTKRTSHIKIVLTSDVKGRPAVQPIKPVKIEPMVEETPVEEVPVVAEKPKRATRKAAK